MKEKDMQYLRDALLFELHIKKKKTVFQAESNLKSYRIRNRLVFITRKFDQMTALPEESFHPVQETHLFYR